jgi:hypothetical protein
MYHSKFNPNCLIINNLNHFFNLFPTFVAELQVNTDIFEKIRQIIVSLDNAEITINVRSSKKKGTQSREAYFEQLNRAVDNIENDRNLVSFTMEEFQSRQMSRSL